MSQSYKKPCRDCGEQIEMSNTGGKWAAYDLEGKGFHNCNGARSSGTGTSESKEQLTLESLGIRVRLLEKAVFKEGK